ncbi:MAG TPA: translation initiation factor eIF-1A, partial [Candidatus Desulfaltia sp.]|nr:translation initiation factor eIF-1A [Candidatus Desulfaltia sp.]
HLITVFTFRGWRMGKKKVLSEKDLRVLVYPSENDVVGVVQKLLGFDRVLVKCQDGHVRICRIRGKMKRRTWIREGDIVLVSPWDFQSDERGEIFHRYTANQVDDLRRKGILTME